MQPLITSLVILAVTIFSIKITEPSARALMDTDELQVKAKKITFYVNMGQARASAFYIGDKLAITAAHVCDDVLASQIKLHPTIDLSKTYRVVDYEYTDRNKLDLCILKMNEEPVGMDAAEIAYNQPKVGSIAYVAGYSGGRHYSFRAGDIMSLDEGEVSMLNGILHEPTYILNMPIQGGASGGPVLTENGEVIGVLIWRLGSMYAGAVSLGPLVSYLSTSRLYKARHAE